MVSEVGYKHEKVRYNKNNKTLMAYIIYGKMVHGTCCRMNTPLEINKLAF